MFSVTIMIEKAETIYPMRQVINLTLLGKYEVQLIN